MPDTQTKAGAAKEPHNRNQKGWGSANMMPARFAAIIVNTAIPLTTSTDRSRFEDVVDAARSCGVAWIIDSYTSLSLLPPLLQGARLNYRLSKLQVNIARERRGSMAKMAALTLTI
jgi:hypothetical protein